MITSSRLDDYFSALSGDSSLSSSNASKEPGWESVPVPVMVNGEAKTEQELSVKCKAVKGKIEFAPTVSCLYFQEELILTANKQGVTVSEKYTKPRKHRLRDVPLTYASCPWFYSIKEQRVSNTGKPFRQSSERKLLPSKRLLLSAHQSCALKMRRLTEMYEVEYIADFKMIQGERFYLVKWVGWPEEASTWEASCNLSCRILIKEFHEDFLKQLMEYFEQNQISWSKLLISRNGLKKTTHTQRLFDALPKRFKYKSSYGEKKIEFRSKLKQWQDTINAASQGKPYVVVENEVDLELPPPNFTYISRNIPGNGVTIPEDPLIGCDCYSVCGLSSSTCVCRSNGYSKSKHLYYENSLIRVKPGKPIYECNSRCKCSMKCPNRVVQKGSKYTLAIFRTPTGKGWGVKALQPIPKGAFVVEYVGEVITNDDADRRGLEYDNEGTTYLFDLDYHETDNPMTVDATRFGNVSHFINHSCSPNLQVYNVFIDNVDPSLPRIGLFARKNIQVNEELAFDYQMTGASRDIEESDDGSEEADKLHEKSDECSDHLSEISDSSRTSSILKKKCLCNASNCRGWLIA